MTLQPQTWQLKIHSPKLDSAAMAEAKIAASPLHESVEPTAEDLPEGPKETPAEELPEAAAVIEGTTAAPTAAPTAEKSAQEKRSQELFEQNELRKKELQEQIQTWNPSWELLALALSFPWSLPHRFI